MENKKENIIKVGFLVSYDWELLKNALPNIYANADAIYLALDKKRLTWSGNLFDFDDAAFKNLIKEIDIDNKINLYEADFYQEKLTPMQCEVRERNMLATQMGKDGWHIQLDADEYFVDFKGFTHYLKRLNPNPNASQKALNVRCNWLPLFKKLNDGYLYVGYDKQLPESIPVATNSPIYEYGRVNGHFNHLSPFFLIHDTWAREPAELWQKISNWGHRNDFDIKKYFEFWKSIDENNFQKVRDFHFLKPKTWEKLSFIKGNSITEFLANMPVILFPLSKLQLFFKNNRNVARIKSFWNKIKS